MASRSPDLTPCDFWLWGFLKSTDRVYRDQPASLAAPKDAIRQNVSAITQQMLLNAVNGVVTRLTAVNAQEPTDCGPTDPTRQKTSTEDIPSFLQLYGTTERPVRVGEGPPCAPQVRGDQCRPAQRQPGLLLRPHGLADGQEAEGRHREGKTVDVSDVWADPVVRFQHRYVSSSPRSI
ncbi:hypothetical protein CEXT_66191 [Caerostris extrusa]|uniref:Uncharacterized protein n=1 Tax=Caerostris extrusa TaxID=172846 RepID=A0AAV4V7D3_CAEEX|nr:hypothetical protein CEXT_66191 [Caerostris extrusa]